MFIGFNLEKYKFITKNLGLQTTIIDYYSNLTVRQTCYTIKNIFENSIKGVCLYNIWEYITLDYEKN